MVHTVSATLNQLQSPPLFSAVFLLPILQSLFDAGPLQSLSSGKQIGNCLSQKEEIYINKYIVQLIHISSRSFMANVGNVDD